MQMHSVKSTRVESIGHDPATSTLAIRFKDSHVTYHYPGVSVEKFQALQKAESIGSHVHQHFVKTKHPFTKIPDQKKEGK